MDRTTGSTDGIAAAPAWPKVERWGRVAYAEALRRQLALAADVETGRAPDTLVEVEHPPTVTLGRHAPETDVLLAPDARATRGIVVARSDRGGKATYHGPGQVVVYPIVHLGRLGLGVKAWVCLLESALREVLASYGLQGKLSERRPGVWVNGAKIASIGLRVVRSVSYHGVSLNVGLDVSGFDCIVPCGSAGERITSIAAERSPAPAADEVAARLTATIAGRLQAHARGKGIIFA
ncbi:MAG TPA: lipoyl(octanoyl) transferase LipB [Candidatus Binatia bacterium]|nr:lipoyl(octanoyl) transferase LipB [Candidatus Binatia bacterium]